MSAPIHRGKQEAASRCQAGRLPWKGFQCSSMSFRDTRKASRSRAVLEGARRPWPLAITLMALCLTAPDVGITDDDHRSDASTFEQTWLGSIVSIEENPESAPLRPIGTGFLVRTVAGPVLLCTAKHVVLNVTGAIKPDLAYRLVDRTDRTSVLMKRSCNANLACGTWPTSMISRAASSHRATDPRSRRLPRTTSCA